MATIEKRKQTATGETFYRVRVRIQGLPEKQKTFKRMIDAKLWAQQTEAAIRRGEVTNVVTKTKGKTLSDVIVRYRQEVLRTLALPDEMESWSLTTIREKVVKIGAKVITHARYAVFQMAEVAVPRDLFRRILDMIDDLRSREPAPC